MWLQGWFGAYAAGCLGHSNILSPARGRGAKRLKASTVMLKPGRVLKLRHARGPEK